MMVAAVQKAQDKGSRKVDVFWLTGLNAVPMGERSECPKDKAVPAKNGGDRPKGHKGAVERAREEHRQKHGKTSTHAIYASRDSKGKGEGRQP